MSALHSLSCALQLLTAPAVCPFLRPPAAHRNQCTGVRRGSSFLFVRPLRRQPSRRRGGDESIYLKVCPAYDAAQLPLCQRSLSNTQRHPCAAWPANARPRTTFLSAASAPLPPVFSGFSPSHSRVRLQCSPWIFISKKYPVMRNMLSNTKRLFILLWLYLKITNRFVF